MGKCMNSWTLANEGQWSLERQAIFPLDLKIRDTFSNTTSPILQVPTEYPAAHFAVYPEVAPESPR